MNVIYSATSTIYLHVKQTEGTETANVSFNLGAATMSYGNNAPFYHWGRKDPMPPSTSLNGLRKNIYGSYSSIGNMNTTDIATTIRTPHYYNISNGNPSLELWNVGNTATTVNINPVIKSIYDPSPVGFHLPCSGAFQGWDESGRSYWQNTVGKQGLYFYQLGPNTGNAVFFPALGYDQGGGYYYAGSYIYIWTAGSSSTTHGYSYDSYSGPGSSDSRNADFSVRPVAE